MQKKTTTMTSSGTNIRESLSALKGAGSDSSLPDMKQSGDIVISNDKALNCNTLPLQNSKNSDSKVNGTKSVKFSTLPSSNKGIFNNHV